MALIVWMKMEMFCEIVAMDMIIIVMIVILLQQEVTIMERMWLELFEHL